MLGTGISEGKSDGTRNSENNPEGPAAAAELLQQLRDAHILPANGVVELRILDAQTGRRGGEPFIETASGYFDAAHAVQLCAAALQDWGAAAKVFMTAQRVNTACLNRHVNKVSAVKKRKTTSKTDIERLVKFLVDVDSARPVKDVPATDVEKAEAKAVLEDVLNDLREVYGWPEPVVTDSGNGYMAEWLIDLPPEDAPLVTAALKALAADHDTPGATIDPTMGDPPQLRRVPGTRNQKAESTKERPHRPCRILHVPEAFTVVTRKQLEELAGQYLPSAPHPGACGKPSANGTGRYRHWLKVDQWLSDRGRAFKIKPQPTTDGRTVYLLTECPFDPAHGRTNEVAVMQDVHGKPSALCMHTGCQGRGWAQFRDAIGAPDPHHYDPPWPSETHARPTGSGANGGLQDLPDLPDPPWEWGEFIPLGDAPPAEPFPLEVLPVPLRQFVEEAAWAVNCPPDFVAVPMLVMAGAAIGNSRRLAITRSHVQGAALYAAVVNRPGSGKSPANSLLREPFDRAQAKWIEEWKVVLGEWKKTDPDGRGPKPVCPRCVVGDTTTESLKATLSENPRGVLMVLDELTSLVAGLNQYKQGRGNDKQFYLSAWANETIINDRRSDKDKDGGPTFIRHPLIGIYGGIPPDVLDRFRSDRSRNEMPTNDGWLDRFLLSYPDDLPAVGETWREVSPEARENWRDVVDLLLSLDMVAGDDGHRRAELVKLTADGRAAWQRFTEQHAAEVNDGAFPDHLRGPWSKLRGYCGRLALIVHQLRVACGATRLKDVDGESVSAAVKLVAYFKAHARRVLDVLGTDRRVEDAKRVWAWVLRERRTEFKAWQVQEDLKSEGRFPTVDALTPALGVLVSHNYIRCRPADGRKAPGRPPATVYEVNPAALNISPIQRQ
jgi:hypothetical protein